MTLYTVYTLHTLYTVYTPHCIYTASLLWAVDVVNLATSCYQSVLVFLPLYCGTSCRTGKISGTIIVPLLACSTILLIFLLLLRIHFYLLIFYLLVF